VGDARRSALRRLAGARQQLVVADGAVGAGVVQQAGPAHGRGQASHRPQGARVPGEGLCHLGDDVLEVPGLENSWAAVVQMAIRSARG